MHDRATDLGSSEVSLSLAFHSQPRHIRGMAFRFQEKTGPNFRVEVSPSIFHPITSPLPPSPSDLLGQIQNKGQIRKQMACRQFSHGPQNLRIDTSGMPLIHNIRQ